MNKDLVFLQVCPIDTYFVFQTHLWLESLKSINNSQNAVSLLFVPKGREQEKEQWNKLIELYPEAQFKFYVGESDIKRLISVYLPVLRPYCLMKYFEEFPELQNKVIFYCDCDILFTEHFNINKYLNDDICYLSNTNSYISASYFNSKIKDVIPDKLEEYKKRDILQETCSLVGISREIAEKNNQHSGGAQYLLKNINSKFWEKVLMDCIRIKIHLQNVNKEFFTNESKGFQSWTADMWAVIFNLWYKNYDVKVVPEMDFAWSTDSISRLDTVGIFHNAGIVGNKQGEIPVFFKGNYHSGNSPFSDLHLKMVHEDERSKTLANWYYVDKMIKLQEKYKL